MHVTIRKESDDKLNCEVWEFYIFTGHSHDCNLEVSLYSYREMERPTRRHDYKSVLRYVSNDSRSSGIKKEDVPMPVGMMEKIVEDIIKRIKFKY